MNILSSVKPWLGFLFGSISNQDLLRTNPQLDKIFLSVGKRIKRFLHWRSTTNIQEDLKKLSYVYNILLALSFVAMVLLATAYKLNLPSQLWFPMYCIFILVAGITVSLFFLKVIIEWLPNHKSVFNRYFKFCMKATLGSVALAFSFLLKSSNYHQVHTSLKSLHLLQPGEPLSSVIWKLPIVILASFIALYVISWMLVSPLCLMSLFCLKMTSRAAHFLEKMTVNNVRLVALIATFLVEFIPE